MVIDGINDLLRNLRAGGVVKKSKRRLSMQRRK
jgi:hypothetical protein